MVAKARFLCKLCKKKFQAHFRYVLHLKQHKKKEGHQLIIGRESEKNFKCNFCPAVYTTPGHCKRHTNKVHYDQVSWSEYSADESSDVEEGGEEEEVSSKNSNNGNTDTSSSTSSLSDSRSDYDSEAGSNKSENDDEEGDNDDEEEDEEQLTKNQKNYRSILAQYQKNKIVHRCKKLVHCNFWTADEKKLARHFLERHGLPRVILDRLQHNEIVAATRQSKKSKLFDSGDEEEDEEENENSSDSSSNDSTDSSSDSNDELNSINYSEVEESTKISTNLQNYGSAKKVSPDLLKNGSAKKVSTNLSNGRPRRTSTFSSVEDGSVKKVQNHRRAGSAKRIEVTKTSTNKLGGGEKKILRSRRKLFADDNNNNSRSNSKTTEEEEKPTTKLVYNCKVKECRFKTVNEVALAQHFNLWHKLPKILIEHLPTSTSSPYPSKNSAQNGGLNCVDEVASEISESFTEGGQKSSKRRKTDDDESAEAKENEQRRCIMM